ncbi:MAG: acetoacetyl-CoA reductase [Gammaproteobacteria bacterium]|nr:acetoacetyl-CoA reductase [Gammaproteobacteria bacterium]
MTKQIALITGGTGGIGTAICKELAGNGVIVVANYFPADKVQAESWLDEMRKEYEHCYIVAADVTDYSSCGDMLESVTDNIGSIDILVNCAGITRDKTLKSMSPDQWNCVINTNLNSAYNVTQQLVQGMMERGFGRIINISSVNGQKGQFGQANYSAAKAGLHGFTMAVAQETASKGVTVNTVSPGYIETTMTSELPEQVLQSIVNAVPLKRMGTAQEVAYAVAWLADQKNAYITGANIPVNGGLFMSS